MKIVLNTFKIIFLSIFFFIFLEIFTRLILFIPTNISVFSYGFKNSVFFEIVDLSKFQIIIADKEKKLNNSKKLKFDEKKIWIFGGSTTHGYACEAKHSSSWPDELFKLDNNFKFRNFAFHGADTDQQINLLYKEIIKSSPNIILWANKFNTKNIFGKTDYRNKHILNYEFQNVRKTKFLLVVKRIDKTLKTYSLFYLTLDKVVIRIKNFLNIKNLKKINVEPSKKDIIYSLKNFEINTIEAIELAKKYGVNEFYIVSLFSEDDLKEKREKISLYESTIVKIEQIYSPYVRIIYSPIQLNKDEAEEYFCDYVHKTLKGNILQAKIIKKQLFRLSKFLNE